MVMIRKAFLYTRTFFLYFDYNAFTATRKPLEGIADHLPSNFSTLSNLKLIDEFIKTFHFVVQLLS